MVNSKNAFWQAFIVTIIIFVLGFLVGYFSELIRINQSSSFIMESEVSLLDQQMRIRNLGNININCQDIKTNFFEFADYVYKNALKLENKENRNKLTDKDLMILQQRYALLRINLWAESIKVNEMCNNSFHNVVYLFDYNTKDFNVNSKQQIFKFVLTDLKNRNPNMVLLLPIAVNLNLTSTELVMKNYNLQKAPAIIIDQKYIIENITSVNELEKYLI